MSPLFLAIGGALLVVLVLTTLVLGRAARGNHAGITTSRAGRVFTLTRLSLGALRRRISRALGRLYLSRTKREARDRVIEAEAAREVAKAMGDMKVYLPIVADAPFTMTAEHCKKAIEAMFGPAMRKLNMPGEFVLLNRINFGLNSIFARLGANENFHRMARRHFFKEGDVERYEAAHRGFVKEEART